MTPKDKAIKLVNTYKEIAYSDLLIQKEIDKNAKQCALIAVDEMLNYFSKETFMMAYPEIAISELQYWTEVKQEIEKI